MKNSYRMTTPQALDHAKALNTHLDDIVPPGAGSVSVLVMALALHIVELCSTQSQVAKQSGKAATAVIDAVMRLYKLKPIRVTSSIRKTNDE